MTMMRPVFRKPLLAAALLAGVVAAVGFSWTAPRAGETIDLGRFERSFTEDFDSLDVSPWGEGVVATRWIAHTPWSGDFGDAKFTDPQPDFPFTTKDGILRIEARKDEDGQWRSGLLASTNPKGQGFSQQYGYFEARMKMPAGKGVWPAFWLIGLDRSRFTSELDVIEYYGHDDTKFQSVWHIWKTKPGETSLGEAHETRVPPGSLSDDFHTFGVEITPEKVSFYFDRTKTWEFDTPPEFKMPFYPLVNLALGSGWPIDETPNPSYLWVDYIHAYRHKPAS